MKQLRLLLCLAALSAGILHAEDEKEQQPPEEIPDFSNLDEYVYVPKSTLNLGSRYMFNGPKMSFRGSGVVAAPELQATGTNVSATGAITYHDGSVSPSNTTNLVSNGNGGSSIVKAPATGTTGNWNYTNTSQLERDGSATGPVVVTSPTTGAQVAYGDGYIRFHTYSAVIEDPTTQSMRGQSNGDLELTASRDLGKLGRHLTWSLTGGFSISDVRANANVAAMGILNTATDTYSLGGQAVPVAPAGSPSTTTATLLDANGQPILDTNGSSQTITINSIYQISASPVASGTTQTSIGTGGAGGFSLADHFLVDGSYYTLRLGPTFILPVGAHTKISLSVGAAILYSGTSLEASEFLFPDTGDAIVQNYIHDTSHLMPGYYADLSAEYALTDTSGFYAGYFYQGGGSYTQSVTGGTLPDGSSAGNYQTKIDFSNQSGIRAGLTLRF